ncbi:helicase-associated domain-containing protein [Corynebacterium sp. H113]|uniref:helicase-associated domain-containing protein n=1 Tax=Corynebacterium sp. H113 TaxID=3133419 RepID=UPI0030B2AA28
MTEITPFPQFRQWLEDRPDRFLIELLHKRPDAVSPPPRSTDVLAARLQLRASIMRMLPELTALQLAVIEAAASAGAELDPVAMSTIIENIGDSLEKAKIDRNQRPTATHIRAAADELRQLGVVYGNGPGGGGTFVGKSSRKKPLPFEDQLMLVDEISSSLPPGWSILPTPGAPSVATIRALLDDVDTKQSRLLTTLAEAGGLGTTKDADPDADPSLPVPRLIANGLLERVDSSTVRLPSRVRAVMRGAAIPDVPVILRPSTPDTTPIRDIDGRAAGNVLELLRITADLLTRLSHDPSPTLKDGVIGVREHRSLLSDIGCSEAELSRAMSYAEAALLATVGTPHPLPPNDTGGDYFTPMAATDEFFEATAAQRWALLIQAWLRHDFAPWLVGTPGPDGKKIALLSAHARLSTLPPLRHAILDVLVQACPAIDGTAPSSAVADFRTVFATQRPILAARTATELLDAALDDLAALGLVVVQGDAVAVTSAGRVAVGSSADDVADTLAPLLPAPTESIMAQADLTILVPGPAAPALATMLESFADLESPGLASVYRVTETSVRRALDSGVAARDIQDFLAQRSLSDVPQSITYLIDDVARRHGLVRGGPAASYIRCDDPAVLANIMSTPVATQFGLRLIADTVAVSQAPLVQVMNALRDAGHSATAEDALGAALDLSPEPFRTSDAPRRPAARPETVTDAGRISQALESMRAGDRAKDSDPSTRIDMDDDPASGAAALSLLQRACRAGRDVTIGYVDRNGHKGRRKVRPATVSGGQVDAIDPATGQVLRFLLHRVTEVVLDD